MLRMRAPYALVAALLLVALIAAIVVGTAFYRGWSAPHEPIHAGARLPTLEELESRPWQHQLVTSGAQCAGGEINGHKLQDGDAPGRPIGGPALAHGQNLTTTAWGEYSSGYTSFATGFSGLLIVRLRDGLTGQHHFFINKNAGGPVVGTVTIDGQTVKRYAEAVFDFADPKVTATNGLKYFDQSEGHLTGFSLCFEWQYDGTYQGRPFVWHWYFYG